MARTDPIDQNPRPANFLLTEEEGHLSRDTMTIKRDDTNKVFDAGTVLKADTGKQVPWTTGATATGILMYRTVVDGADATAVVLTRNAEVMFDGLIMDTDASAKLALLGIIVRK